VKSQIRRQVRRVDGWPHEALEEETTPKGTATRSCEDVVVGIERSIEGSDAIGKVRPKVVAERARDANGSASVRLGGANFGPTANHREGLGNLRSCVSSS
jgi:hypothetical protein